MWRDGSLFSDVRYGARVLVRQRGFAAVAMLTTALAIGVTATLFSVFDAVLLRPLPWTRADRLVRFTETHAGATRELPLSITNIAWRAMAPMTTVEGLSAWSRSTVTLAVADVVERRVGRIGHSWYLCDASRVAARRAASSRLTMRPRWCCRTASGWRASPARRTPSGRSGRAERPDRHHRRRDAGRFRVSRIPARACGAHFASLPPLAITILGSMARLRDGATRRKQPRSYCTRPQCAVLDQCGVRRVRCSGPARVAADPALDALTRDVRPGLVALFAAGLLLLVMAVANLASLELARATTRLPRDCDSLGPGRRTAPRPSSSWCSNSCCCRPPRRRSVSPWRPSCIAHFRRCFRRLSPDPREFAFRMPVVLVAFAIAASTVS
jgi:hypothetical protein